MSGSWRMSLVVFCRAQAHHFLEDKGRTNKERGDVKIGRSEESQGCWEIKRQSAWTIEHTNTHFRWNGSERLVPCRMTDIHTQHYRQCVCVSTVRECNGSKSKRSAVYFYKLKLLLNLNELALCPCLLLHLLLWHHLYFFLSELSVSASQNVPLRLWFSFSKLI